MGEGLTRTEEIAIEALVAPTYELEPTCPMCHYHGASRVWFEVEDGKRIREFAVVPCYLEWCAAHGVHAPIRKGEQLPAFRDPRYEEASGIRCDNCHYFSHPSAFCKPVAPDPIPPSKDRG